MHINLSSFASAKDQYQSSCLLTNFLLSHSERKIDQIEDRLAGIESLLQQLVSAKSTPGADRLTPASSTGQQGQVYGTRTLRTLAASTNRSPSTESSTRRNRDISSPDQGANGENTSTLFDPEDAETFEGNSSLAAHTAFASEFCKNLNDDPCFSPQYGCTTSCRDHIVY